MDFLISGEHLNPFYLIAAGFIIGVLGGLFGVGGSFLAGPFLLLMGLHANFAVGTDLAHIVGKSIVAAKKHNTLGNVDLKLGALMAVGSVVGAEAGAMLIQWLKRIGQVDSVVAISYFVVLVGISAFMSWEGIATLRMKRAQSRAGQTAEKSQPQKDENAFGGMARKVQALRLPPMVHLPISGIESVSLWAILLVALFCGVLAGFLGGGAGYVRMPRDGLPAGRADEHRGGDGFIRDHHFGGLRHLFPRDQGQRGFPGRAGDAHRGGHRRADRRRRHPIFARPEAASGVRAAAAHRGGPAGLPSLFSRSLTAGFTRFYPWLAVNGFFLAILGRFRAQCAHPPMIIYVCRNGVEIGQYTRQDFEFLLSHHRLFHTDHFWTDGMEEWKLLTAAKAYFCQHEKCRHCGAKMSEHKPVTVGARIGQMKSICRKCGHSEYHPASEFLDDPDEETAGEFAAASETAAEPETEKTEEFAAGAMSEE